jgi:branched-chain amino acid transport system substrate-binding protein
MARLSSFSVALVVAIATACSTPTAARGNAPSTRTIVVDGVERTAEDVASELVADAANRRSTDRSGAKTAYRRVVDEFSDTRSRGTATVQLAALLLDEKAPSSAQEAEKWLQRLLLDDPADDNADEARALLSRAQQATGNASAPALASIAALPADERGAAVIKLARELMATGKAKDAVTALLSSLPKVSGADRAAAEQALIDALDVPAGAGGVAFSGVAALRERYGSSDGFADEVLLWKQARIELHLRNVKEASNLAAALVGKHPRSRFAEAARGMTARLASFVEVDARAIGVVLPLSGEYAAYGKRALVALRLAFNLPLAGGDDTVEELDEATGELVQRAKKEALAGTLTTSGGLKLIVKDSAGKNDVATAAVRDLVEKHHVVAVLGDILVDTSLPIALACEDYGVPLLSLSRRDGVPEAGPWSFRLALTPKKQAQALAAYAVDELKMKRFGIMYPKHAFGIELMGYFWDALDERQAEITAIESYAHDQTTFTNEARSLVGRGLGGGGGEVASCRSAAAGIGNEYRRKKAMEGCNDRTRPLIDFEALFIPDSYKTVGFVVPALVAEDMLMTNNRTAIDAYKKATGNGSVRSVQLLGASTWNDPDVAVRLGRQVDGAVFVDGFDMTDQTPLVQRFVDGFNRGARSRPSLLEAQTYDAARLLGTVLEGSGGKRPASRAEVRAALDAVEGFVGVTGTIGFDAQGDSVTPLHFFRIEREKVDAFDVKER